MLIREERPADHASVEELQLAAFGAGPHGAEVVALVRDLRASLAEEPGLSLVAEDDGAVIGHALFTRSRLDAPRQLVDVQVLSPLGVRPDRQRRGVGRGLIERGLDLLAERGVPLVFLEGSPDYYAQSGFSPAAQHGFRRPSLRIPDAAFQVRLLPAYEPWMTGTLVYRQTFWDHDLVGLRDAPARLSPVFRLHEVTVDCADVALVAEFWSTLLGAELREPLPGWRRLGPLTDGGPVLNFQPVPEPKQGKSRIHLDFVTDDVTGAVSRVVQLGGSDPGERHEYDEGVVVVMADPEGHEFCLVAYRKS